MGQLTFFKGLFIGIAVSAGLWFGAFFAVKKIFKKDHPQKITQPVNYADNSEIFNEFA